MNTIVILIVLAAALVLAIGLAFLPMRLLLTHIAANIQQFILRQRERRAARGARIQARRDFGDNNFISMLTREILTRD